MVCTLGKSKLGGFQLWIARVERDTFKQLLAWEADNDSSKVHRATVRRGEVRSPQGLSPSL